MPPGASTSRSGFPPGDRTATVKTLVVTDLVASTRLFATLGDRRAADLSARHERLARDLILECGGREIDKADGFLLLFDRAIDAVRFALAYHRGLADLSESEGVDLAARVGIHLGEVYERRNTPEDVARGAKPVEIEGVSKPLAARVTALADGRQTLLTRAAFDLARQGATSDPLDVHGHLRWLAHGPYRLKGVDEPVEIFEVGVTGFAPLVVPRSTAKARRAVSGDDELTLGWRPAPGLEIPRRPHWLLSEKLGEGGFGEVWLAKHGKTGDKRVFKFCYRVDRLRSLQREVTLFRLLKETLGARPDIARILNWNFDRAPYFVESEYTEGGNLLEWSAERGGAAAIPLPIRLELIAQVADALAAAHSVGVLHKDVKPSNVLITTGAAGEPRVRLTDFGIGVVTDRGVLADRGITLFELTEMVADFPSTAGGTHLYMAPELVEGRTPSVQADVYAMGVMLYQFLVGDFSRALAPGWRRDLDDEILREDIAAMVDGHPERRLRDAGEVARRLRDLEQRRERREAERRERAERKAERRALERAHRRRKVSALVAIAALVVLGIVSVLAFQAIEAREEAERRRAQAENLIGFMVGDLRDKLEPIGHLDILDEVGDQALEYFDAVPASDLTDDEIYRRSQALYQIGEVRMAQGDLKEALDAYRDSLALAQRLTERDPDEGRWLKALGAAYFGVGRVHWRRNELAEAETQFRMYLDLAEGRAADVPESSDWQLELAYAHANLGHLLEARGNLLGALEHFENTLEIQRRLVAAHPDETSYRRELALSYNSAGSVLEALGRLDEALASYRSDLALKEGLRSVVTEDRSLDRSLAVSHNFLSALLQALGQMELAHAHADQALAIASDLVRTDPANSRWNREMAINRLRRASLLHAEGRHVDALDESRTAFGTLDELVRQETDDARWQLDRAMALRWIGTLLLELGRTAEAAERLAAAEDVLREQLGSSGPTLQTQRELATVHLAQARLELHRDDADRSRAFRRHALELLAGPASGSRDKRILDPYFRALVGLGRESEARQTLETLDSIGYRNPDFLRFCQDHGFGDGRASREAELRDNSDPFTRSTSVRSIHQEDRSRHA